MTLSKPLLLQAVLFTFCIFIMAFYSQPTLADESNLAPDVIVLDNEPFKKLGPFLEILKDPNDDLSPFEIVLPEWTTAWSQVEQSVLNLGYTEDVYWVRLNIDASASIYKKWDLVISMPLLDYVDIYQVFQDSGPRLIYRSGLKRAFNNREEDHRFFIIPLEIYNEREKPGSFLMHIKTKSTFYVPMALYPGGEFWAPLQQADIINWMFFGVILAMVIYNLFLYLSVRDKSYLYYVFFISSFALLHMSLDGYLFQHFWPQDIGYSYAPDMIFAAASVLFGFLFISHFLNLKAYLPRVNNFITLAAFSQIPVIIAAIYYPNIALDRWTIPLLGLMLLTAVSVGIYAYSKGLVTAQYFVLAWVLFSIGNIYFLLVLSGINLLPISPFYASKAASFAEAMLLSFALAHRIRILRDEREQQRIKAESQNYFLAQISHEIRTPLNGVLGTVDLLEQTELNDEQKSYVDIIQASGKSLLSLVSDVLDYSKIEAGKMLVQKEHIAVHDLARHQVELFRSQAEQKKLEFTLHIDTNVPEWIVCDSQRLRQILSNIIANALKFTDQGYVRIHLSSADSQLIFVVNDSGIGISAAEQKELFTAYQQVDLGNRRVYGGTGLGLAISKELVELLGGTLAVESEINRGSEFRISVPFTISKEIVSTSSNSTPFSIAIDTPLNVLVAEDNVVNQKVVSGLLSKQGHFVTVVPQGDEAVSLRIQAEFNFDLILMDCEMPGMDGYEATRAIREYEKLHGLPNVPIVALTAHALEEVRERCLQSGMNDFLTKPINTQRLMRTIGHIFK